MKNKPLYLKIKTDPLVENPLSAATITCYMPENTVIEQSAKPAVTFLKEHGHDSLVSFGCGHQINRIDNHLRLIIGLGLKYYVAIDCHSHIEPDCPELFMAPDKALALLKSYYQDRPATFWEMVRLYPGTFIEDLAGVHCAVVVCQRVYPSFRWEDVIISMDPKLVLQEDLHGCERQQLRGKHYVRTLSNIRRFGLQPFRPWPIFPGEKNLALWHRRNLGAEFETGGSFKWLRRLGQAIIG